jgi:hypothetical protein
MERQIEQADFILIVCTAAYLRRYRGEEQPGKGLGATWEAVLSRQELYEAQGKSKKFVPVLFEGAPSEAIPKVLRQYTYYVLMDGYERLLRYLTNQPAIVPNNVGDKRKMPPDPR